MRAAPSISGAVGAASSGAWLCCRSACEPLHQIRSWGRPLLERGFIVVGLDQFCAPNWLLRARVHSVYLAWAGETKKTDGDWISQAAARRMVASSSSSGTCALVVVVVGGGGGDGGWRRIENWMRPHRRCHWRRWRWWRLERNWELGEHVLLLVCMRPRHRRQSLFRSTEPCKSFFTP